MKHTSISGLIALCLVTCGLFCSSFALSLPFWSSEDSAFAAEDSDYSIFTAGIWGFCTNVTTDDNIMSAHCTPYRNWLFGSPNEAYNITFASVHMDVAAVGLCKLARGSPELAALEATLPMSTRQFNAFYDASCGSWSRFSLGINIFTVIVAILAVPVYSVAVAYWFCPPSVHTQTSISRLGLRLLALLVISSIFVLAAWSKQCPAHVPFGSAYYSAFVASLLYIFSGMAAIKYHMYDLPRIHELAKLSNHAQPTPDVVFIELGTPVHDKLQTAEITPLHVAPPVAIRV
ncbi:hypothetical protein ACHHYP_20406 [Achlya hypogyna]|uniref:Membrane-associated protein n=1 Tax=Achlya hypogyna TaxID=1202772 RepID=A0A1V9ZJ61_ACHHY|nr:hypothetical protein ACHHYP_20406 [Achlya hypogyna]